MTTLRVIVLDGADWLWCDEHRGQLPNLDSIASAGCSAPLIACDEPTTPDAVAALLSGREIGIPWVQDDRFSTSAELIRTKPWFGELGRYGMTMSLTNVPLTWPAFPMPQGCFVVSGYPVPMGADRDLTRRWHFPPSLNVDTYPIASVMNDIGAGGSPDVEMIAQAEHEMVLWLETASRCDLEIIWLRSSDSAGHHHWGSDQYLTVMRHLDFLVGHLRTGADNTLVISDHGFDALASPRCSRYMNTDHGAPALTAGLKGGHAMEGILFAAGDRIAPQGEIGDQKLLEVAGGIFDVLQLPPAPGMISRAPQWAWAMPTPEQEESMHKQLKALGYVE